MSEEKGKADVENLRDFYKGAYAALAAVLAVLENSEGIDAYHLELQIVDMQDRILNRLLDCEGAAWASLLRG